MTNTTIVDGQGNFIGSMPTREAHDKGLWCAIVALVLKDLEGNVWVQVRGPAAASPGLLDFTCGGHVDEGETIKQALKRELKEETGLRLSVGKQKPLDFPSSFERRERTVRHYHFIFVATTDKTPKADGKEVAGFKKIVVKELVEKVEKHREEFTVPFAEFITKHWGDYNG